MPTKKKPVTRKAQKPHLSRDLGTPPLVSVPAGYEKGPRWPQRVKDLPMLRPLMWPLPALVVEAAEIGSEIKRCWGCMATASEALERAMALVKDEKVLSELEFAWHQLQPSMPPAWVTKPPC